MCSQSLATGMIALPILLKLRLTCALLRPRSSCAPAVFAFPMFPRSRYESTYRQQTIGSMRRSNCSYVSRILIWILPRWSGKRGLHYVGDTIDLWQRQSAELFAPWLRHFPDGCWSWRLYQKQSRSRQRVPLWRVLPWTGRVDS
jgi:hypothetical protein